jgi:hypothetical protein
MNWEHEGHSFVVRMPLIPVDDEGKKSYVSHGEVCCLHATSRALRALAPVVSGRQNTAPPSPVPVRPCQQIPPARRCESG